MATYDDKQWILEHITNSYTTSDDTGLCEMVVQCEPGTALVVDFPCLLDDSPPNVLEDPAPQSLDIASDMALIGYRPRSNTERIIEKIKQDKKNKAKIKRISWTKNTSKLNESELSDLFSRKNKISSVESSKTSKNISLLTKMIQKSPNIPFMEYAKFDGTTQMSVTTRTMKIFLRVGEEPSVDYPMYVCVTHNSKISDLIGLICWLYTKESRQPPLRGNVDCYSLHIAEEDGQVDWDFQALQQKDYIEKYGFNVLALVENKDAFNETLQNIVVTLTVSGGGFSKLQVESKEISLKEIISRVINKRKDMLKIIDTGLDYHLEREDEPGVVLDPSKTLADINCFEFAVVRDNSKRNNWPIDVQPASVPISYHSYKVTWLLKIGKCDAQLNFYQEKIEVQPLQSKLEGSFLVFKTPHPVTYSIEHLVEFCRKQERKGKMEIEMKCHSEHKLKHYFFECEAKIGQEILDKCKCILETRFNSPRKEYWREKKPFRRNNSLSVNRRSRIDKHINEV